MVRGILCLLLLLLASCVSGQAPRSESLLREAEIYSDTTWSGRIVIEGTVRVVKGVTLTIRPGTEVFFVRRDADRDGLGDSTLVVEGSLRAVGTADAPIRFASAAEDPKPGDWLEIRVDFSKDVHLRHCFIRDSAYTLHAHFTRALIEDCVIRGNIDGSRLGQANVTIRNCLIEDNLGKGVNFRNATVELSDNIIRGNASGVFLFETDRRSTIVGNNIYGNNDNLRLGDFFQGEVATSGNWWGTADTDEIRATIYDSRRDPSIGTVHIDPAPRWIFTAGPRRPAQLVERWSYRTQGFVDAPAIAEEKLFVASWDGYIAALDESGKPLWRRQTGEVIDASMALDSSTLYFQNWGRQVLALSRGDGRIQWRFNYDPSPADDHRQGGLVHQGALLLVPAWNGTLYAVEAKSGEERWRFDAGQPLRAAPAVESGRIYQPSGTGVLSALNAEGQMLWQVLLGAPALSTPALTSQGPVVVSRAGEVLALDRAGQERWRRPLDEPCFYGAPIYSGGALFLATAAGRLWKLDGESGQTIWRRDDLGPVYATPALTGHRLLIGDNNGEVHLIDADSGERLDRFRTGGAVQSRAVAFADGWAVGSRDGFLRLLTIQDRPFSETP